MKKYAIIVAGGSGQRMQSKLPKQFIELAGKPILMHTIERFYEFGKDLEIIVVLPESHIHTWKMLIQNHQFKIKHNIVQGGDIRFVSVKNGLNAIHYEGLVAIHDGVRPLVSIETINRCFEHAGKYGNAIPCIPVYETVRRVNGYNNVMDDRSALRLIQTPQVFNTTLIKKAYEQTAKPEFTDDASVLESLGENIRLVEGNRENIKITDPFDLQIASSVLSNKV